MALTNASRSCIKFEMARRVKLDDGLALSQESGTVYNDLARSIHSLNVERDLPANKGIVSGDIANQ